MALHETALSPAQRLKRAFRRPAMIVAGCLAAATTLAWWSLLTNVSGMSDGSGAMVTMQQTEPVWTPWYLISTFTMWSLMMVAMMLPSAAPMILLYSKLVRQRGPGAAADRVLFASSYVAIWLLFSAFATVGQAVMIDVGLLDAVSLRLGPRPLAGAMLVVVGLYELSPLKVACLNACRSPLSFLMRLWRPGRAGAVRLGLTHGIYCVGCCWGLMLLLFVGGVMNIAWIAGLAVIVFAEKAVPRPLDKVVAGVLVAAGLFVSSTGVSLA